MKGFPSSRTVEMLRSRYPEGCRVELVCMNDPYTRLKPGDQGEVAFVDDIGTIHVRWDNGSSHGVAMAKTKLNACDSSSNEL